MVKSPARYSPPCRRPACGHSIGHHRHWRLGSDCGLCGRDRCPDYLAPTLWTQLRRRRAE